MSRRGNLRSDYIHYEDSMKRTICYFKSNRAQSMNHDHENSKYNLFCNSISCKSNEIMTVYLGSADIPLTTYNISKYNNVFFFIYLIGSGRILVRVMMEPLISLSRRVFCQLCLLLKIIRQLH